MTQQEYLKEMIDELKSYIDVRNTKMIELDELFKQKGAKSEEDIIKILKDGLLTDLDLDLYYNTSQLTADTNTLCKKICDFLYFGKIIKNDINIDDCQNIPGFTQFMKEYEPYRTTFILTPENETKEVNIDQYNLDKSTFKKTITSQNILNIIDENRNGNTSKRI